MNSNEVEAMIRDVILHHGLPFQVVSVVGSQGRWNVSVRDLNAGVVTFAIPDGRPLDMRVNIQQHLEAED